MYNPKYLHIESGEIIDALSYKKDTFMEIREYLLSVGEIEPTESIPSDEEFIEAGIEELDGDGEYRKITP